VKLGALPSKSTDTAEVQRIQSKLGLTLGKLKSETANKPRVEEDAGVIITKVDKGSPADKAGFQTGDLILEANRKKIRTPEEYENILSSLVNGHKALFLVKRNELTLYIALSF
jgi:S1-C subfamily serine protease